MKLFGLSALLILTACSSGSGSRSGHHANVQCLTGERMMAVTNNSSKDVWLGLTSGSIPCKSSSDCDAFGGNCVAVSGLPPIPGPHGRMILQGACGCSSVNTNCGSLASCNVSDYYCYWNSPRIAQSSYKNAAGNFTTHMQNKGDSVTICFPPVVNNATVQWSGNLFARYGCDANGQNCGSADCSTNVIGGNNGSCSSSLCGPGSAQACLNNGLCAPQDGTCRLGSGGQPPDTLAEFTLVNYQVSPNVDYYDVSVINGINMGVSMTPSDGTFVNCSSYVESTSCSNQFGCFWNGSSCAKNPYFCGTPGAQQASDPLGYLKACSWNLNMNIPTFGDQSALLTQIAGDNCGLFTNQNDCGLPFCQWNGSACVSSGSIISPCPAAGCPTGQVCGLALNNNDANVQGKFIQTCGIPLDAYYSADQICGTIRASNPLDNLYPLPCVNSGRQQTMIDLFGCAGSNQTGSCYQNGAASTCCGAPTVPANNCAGLDALSCMANPGCYWDSGSCVSVSTIWPVPAPGANNTGAANSDWQLYILPWITPLKQACPTAYSFPYDDVTSTFTCLNPPSYQIELFDITTSH